MDLDISFIRKLLLLQLMHTYGLRQNVQLDMKFGAFRRSDLNSRSVGIFLHNYKYCSRKTLISESPSVVLTHRPVKVCDHEVPSNAYSILKVDESW